MTAGIRELIDDLEVLICGLDGDGRVHHFNRACERLTDLARDEVIGRPWSELFAGGASDAQLAALWQRLEDDAPVAAFEGLCRRGRNIRWQFSRLAAPAGAVTRWAVGVDLTDERAALARSRELERAAALGTLVSGLAHELRNPLNGALLQLACAERVLPAGDDRLATATDAVTAATTEVRRIAALVDDFLGLVRPRRLQLAREDLRAVTERALDRAAPRAAAAGVEVRLPPGPPVVAELDAARIQSAIYQLATNAIDAAADGAPWVEVVIDSGGRSVNVEVADGGAGVDAVAAAMFEPFFTTKLGGTGLGLAIVQRAVGDHDGVVSHRRDGARTVFRIDLPIARGTASPRPPAGAAMP